jgi:hypothetical protein
MRAHRRIFAPPRRSTRRHARPVRSIHHHRLRDRGGARRGSDAQHRSALAGAEAAQIAFGLARALPRILRFGLAPPGVLPPIPLRSMVAATAGAPLCPSIDTRPRNPRAANVPLGVSRWWLHRPRHAASRGSPRGAASCPYGGNAFLAHQPEGPQPCSRIAAPVPAATYAFVHAGAGFRRPSPCRRRGDRGWGVGVF